MTTQAMQKAKDFSTPEQPMSGGGDEVPSTLKVVLATRTEGPFQMATARHERLTVDAYPIPPYLVLQCTGDDEGLDDVRRSAGPAGVLLYETRANGRRTLFLEGGEAEERLISRLIERAAHLIPPIRWQGGDARLTLLVDEDTDLRALAAMFPEGRLLSKRTLAEGSRAREALGSPLFLPTLTAKQASALVAAFEAGYYEFPRRVTTEDVSNALGVARSTFQEHLNRAEQHVVRATIPLVRMRAAASREAGADRARDEALAVYSRFSRELGLYVRLEILEGRVSGVQLTHDPLEGPSPSHPYLTRILEHVRTGKGDLADIPLHLEVTPFERRVLDTLQTIPAGDTITYGEVARRVGQSKAARAVGQAVARNPIPVVIPCHRVVPASGGIGHYSGGDGSATKRKLLEREGALAAERPRLTSRRRGKESRDAR